MDSEKCGRFFWEEQFPDWAARLLSGLRNGFNAGKMKARTTLLVAHDVSRVSRTLTARFRCSK